MAQVEWKPSDSTFSRASYAYKPINQILMGFPMDHPMSLPNTVYVTLEPRFLYHHVANYDLVYQREKNEFGVSVAGEKPIKDNFPVGRRRT